MFELESGHMLSKSDSFCSFPHGHTRTVELVYEADGLDSNQMVCDYRAVKMMMKEYLDSFDHSMCVNTQDPHYEDLHRLFGDRIIPFEGIDPTTEVMAKTIYDEGARRLKEFIESDDKYFQLQSGLRLARVRVWETSTSWAEYAQ